MATAKNLLPFLLMLLHIVPAIMCAIKYFKGETKFLLPMLLFGAGWVLLFVPTLFVMFFGSFFPDYTNLLNALEIVSVVASILTTIANIGALIMLAMDFLNDDQQSLLIIAGLFGISIFLSIALNVLSFIAPEMLKRLAPLPRIISILSTILYFGGIAMIGLKLFNNQAKPEMIIVIVFTTLALLNIAYNFIRSIQAPLPTPDETCHHESIPAETVAPTCTTLGSTTYVCKHCGQSLQIIYTEDALGHDYQAVEQVEATCQNEGYTLYRCSRDGCGDQFYGNTVSPLDHDYQYVETIESTCTMEGYSVYECVNGCRHQIVGDRQPLAEHEFNDWQVTVTANCYHEGKKERKCKNCPATETEITPIAHLSAILPEEPATLEFTGLTEGAYCEKCYDILIPQVEIPKLIQWDGQIISSFAGGSGTEKDPYLISTAGQLAYLANAINGSDHNVYYDKCYALTGNIDLKGSEWNPIGCYYTSSSGHSDARVFSGSFYGNNYTISNFKITSPKTSYYEYFGLFGRVYGSIENVNISNAQISLSSTAYYVGALAGYIQGTFVYDCSVLNSSIGGKALTAGILAGESGAILEECEIYSNCTINMTETTYVGGLVGYNTNKITRCMACADVAGNYGASELYTGGLVGYSDGGTITQSSGMGDVYAINSGIYHAYTYVGGLVGTLNKGSVDKCYSQGTIDVQVLGYDSTASVGGLIGSAGSGSSVYNSQSKASVSADGGYISCGGFIGSASGTFYNSISEGSVYASFSKYGDIGGFGGVGGTFNNCVAKGNVTVNIESNSATVHVSRFIGTRGTVNNCYILKTQVLSGASEWNTNWQEVTSSQLKTKLFYVTTLGWDEEEWNLNNVTNGNVMPYRVKLN